VGDSPVGTRPSAPCFQNQAGLGSDRERARRPLFLQRDNRIMDEACTGIQNECPEEERTRSSDNHKSLFQKQSQ